MSIFRTNKSIVRVSIADTECVIISIVTTQIRWTTGSYNYSSIKAPVKVFVQNVGEAINVSLDIKFIRIFQYLFKTLKKVDIGW